jgi:hypothetical protein
MNHEEDSSAKRVEGLTGLTRTGFITQNASVKHVWSILRYANVGAIVVTLIVGGIPHVACACTPAGQKSPAKDLLPFAPGSCCGKSCAKPDSGEPERHCCCCKNHKSKSTPARAKSRASLSQVPCQKTPVSMEVFPSAGTPEKIVHDVGAGQALASDLSPIKDAKPARLAREIAAVAPPTDRVILLRHFII